MTDRMWRILVVDDEESIRRLLRTYLEDEGFLVTLAATGEEGLEALSREIVHGAIVDMRLPGMDGNRFIELAHGLHPGLKFVVYTGSIDYQPSAALENCGLRNCDVFRKPLRDMSVLCTAMLDLLQIRTGGEDG